jgi:hypothetical protein
MRRVVTLFVEPLQALEGIFEGEYRLLGRSLVLALAGTADQVRRGVEEFRDCALLDAQPGFYTLCALGCATRAVGGFLGGDKRGLGSICRAPGMSPKGRPRLAECIPSNASCP